jgi:hypothetical protein
MKSETQGVIFNTSDLPSGGYPQGVVLHDIDALMAKSAVEDAHLYLGHEVIIRRRIRPEDGVDRCPVCYDPVYDQSNNENCPNCWGTTFDGGFFPPEKSRAIFAELSERIELTKNGLVRVVTPRVTMPPTPKVREGDLLVRIGKDGKEKDRFWIKEVEIIEIAPSYEVVGQRFGVTKIQYGDPGYDIPLE